MPGIKGSGHKAHETLRARLGDEKYLQHIKSRGRKGGLVKVPKGFAIMQPGKLSDISRRGGESKKEATND
jgi:hypothetical protein